MYRDSSSFTSTFSATAATLALVASLFWASSSAAQSNTTAAPPQAPADGAAAAQQSVPTIEVSGFVDFYFGYNFNTPATRQAQLRNFDIQHNSFSLNLAEVAFERKPNNESRGGFRVDLDYGGAAQMVHASEPGGPAVFQNILQAYVSYLAPIGNGLQVDFGKFATPMGNEVIKTRDNWNYSRSLLFTLAEPYYHAGLRVTYTVNDRVTLAAHLVNGWNNVSDNNNAKTVGIQATLKPAPALTITQTYMGGPEQTANNADWRHLLDTVVSYAATPHITLAANYDYGQDSIPGSTVIWQGVAAYFRYQPRSWFAITPRAEYYDDRDGFTTGVAQKVKEITLTGELAHKDGILVRIEFRRDFSDQPFFQKNTDTPVKGQSTLTVGAIYAFSSKIR